MLLSKENWNEYHSAAEWCAKRNLTGSIGDPLPKCLAAAVYNEISAYPEAFERMVRDTAYMLAMNSRSTNQE